MIIGIDASRANREERTGTEWYSYYLIQELKKIPLKSGDKFILYSLDKLKGELGELPFGWESRILSWKFKYLWTQIRLAWEVYKNPPDVLFIPSHCLPFFCRSKKVITLHDFAFKRFKNVYPLIQRIYLNLVYWWAAIKAEKIIVPSKFTKSEALKFYRIKENRIKVISEGYNPRIFYQEKNKEKTELILKKYEIRKPYFIYVGRIEIKKNIIGLIGAYKKLIEKRGADNVPQMILIGKAGFGFKIIKKRVESLKPKVFLFGYIKEEDLVHFYNAAVAFIFPSFYEGFGLPVLEALACGLPTIVSSTDALLEVGGPAVLSFNQNNEDELVEAMEKILDNQELRQGLIEKGLSWVKNFSWGKCAQETKATLEEVFKN